MLLPEVEPVYFTPPLAGGAQPAMQSFFQALLYNLEIPVFLVFQGNIQMCIRDRQLQHSELTCMELPYLIEDFLA